MDHELIRDFMKKQGCEDACIKIDRHKVFDSLNREFVFFLMFTGLESVLALILFL